MIEVVDEISDLVNCFDTPSFRDVREKVGTERENSLWLTLSTMHGVPRKSNYSVTRHLYDSTMRGPVRGKFNVSTLGSNVGFVHDLPEDILKEKRGKVRGIWPLVAAYVTLDVISAILGEEVAYGPVVPDGSEIYGRVGGVNLETNFFELVSDPVMSSSAIPERNGKEYFITRNRHGLEEAILSDKGRSLFVDLLDKNYDRIIVSDEGILRAYHHILNRLRSFLQMLDIDERLKPSEKPEISNKISSFVLIVERKIKEQDILDGVFLRDRINSDYLRSREVISDNKRERPSALHLVTKIESPYRITLEKTLYGGYIDRMINGTVKLINHFASNPSVDYMHPILAKIGDSIDNAALWGPELQNMTSINRKAKQVLRGGVNALRHANASSVPPRETVNLYNALSYLLETLGSSIEDYRSFVSNKEDTYYKEHVKISEQMKKRLDGYRQYLKEVRPGFLDRMRA